MEILFLFFIILVVIQWYFKTKQTKALHEHYNKFLQSGNVLVERNRGIYSGAIIILQLDEEANIENCLLLSGATFFASWQSCDEIVNENLLTLKEQEYFKRLKNPVQKVISKAIQTYIQSKEEELQLLD